MERRADPRLSPHAFQLGGDDAGVVEHQQVARAQGGGQVAHSLVAGSGPVQDQHARRIARGCRVERDPLGRQGEIEKVDVHLVATAAFLAGAGLGAARRAGVMVTGLVAAPGSVTGAPRAGVEAGAIGT